MQIVQLAIKDLRILFRDKLGAFFILGFPILMGLFFGMVMSGVSGGSRGKMEVAIVDQDQSEMSKKFVEALNKNDSIRLVPDELEQAMESVRTAKRTGVLVVPKGFGETAGIFWEPQPEIQLGMDPSRSAESAMMQGFAMQAMGDLIGERFNNPKQFLPSVEQAKQALLGDPVVAAATKQLAGNFFDSLEEMLNSADELQQDDQSNGLGERPLQFANIKNLDIARQLDPKSVQGQVQKLRSRWDISFPQAMLWGVLGCVAGFSISIARERTHGTMVRLLASPLNKMQILLGKALACFLSAVGVMIVLTILGLILKMQPGDYPKLIVAGLATAVCFVGIMMTISVLGKTEQSVSGSGWAINMIMAMLGGCMIPVMFMPEIFQTLSVVSPIRWAILAIEGAIWRQFSWQEMALPCTILLVIGVVGFAIGTTILARRNA